MLDKAFVPANDLVPRIAKEPAFASYIVVLEPDPACGEPQFEILPASDALVHVLPHQIDELRDIAATDRTLSVRSLPLQGPR